MVKFNVWSDIKHFTTVTNTIIKLSSNSFFKKSFFLMKFNNKDTSLM